MIKKREKLYVGPWAGKNIEAPAFQRKAEWVRYMRERLHLLEFQAIAFKILKLEELKKRRKIEN